MYVYFETTHIHIWFLWSPKADHCLPSGSPFLSETANRVQPQQHSQERRKERRKGRKKETEKRTVFRGPMQPRLARHLHCVTPKRSKQVVRIDAVYFENER